MRHVVVAGELHRHAGRTEPVGVREPLVAERIAASDHDERRRQAVQVRRERGRCVRLGLVGARSRDSAASTTPSRSSRETGPRRTPRTTARTCGGRGRDRSASGPAAPGLPRRGRAEPPPPPGWRPSCRRRPRPGKDRPRAPRPRRRASSPRPSSPRSRRDTGSPAPGGSPPPRRSRRRPAPGCGTSSRASRGSRTPIRRRGRTPRAAARPVPPGGPPAVPPRRPRVAGPVHPHRDRPGRPGDRALLGRAPVVRLGQRHEQLGEIATPVREREAHARRPSRRDEIVQKSFDLRICGDGRILGPIVRAVKLLPLRWSRLRSCAGPPSSSRCARPRPARPSRRRLRGSPSGSGRGGAAPCGTRCR